MDSVLTVTLHVLAAWIAGAAIGLERSFHGRPAGFRTHALVCVSSALLMAVTAYQWDWLGVTVPIETIRTDPTRMAQGIMTGIGFLGAGVIFKEGLTIRGLTTAASIWTTAAIGILYGVGLTYPAILGTGLTIATLSAFRWIEARIPVQIYAQYMLRFPKAKTMPEADVIALLAGHGFSVANLNYRLADEGHVFEYRMTLRTGDRTNLGALARRMATLEDVLEFRLSPNGD
ncbi:MAG: MgtC/SapB family protein [Bauldia sp.]|nr:MgtC/SapB family protein [Bauldia sp.]